MKRTFRIAKVISTDDFYGEFYNLHSSTMHASLDAVIELSEDAYRFEKTLFTMYISFTLSKAGYYLFFPNYNEVPITSNDDFTPSTNWRAEEWIASYLTFEHDPSTDIWVKEYRNDSGRIIRLIFIRQLSSVNEDFLVKFEQIKQTDYDNIAVYHPIIPKFIKKQRIDSLGLHFPEDTIYSHIEFVTRFLPNEKDLKKANKNWNKIRDNLISTFVKSYDFLIYSLYYTEYNQSIRFLNDAKGELNDKRKFDGVVRKIAYAVEGLVTIIGRVETVLSKKETMGSVIKNKSIKEIIIKDFGEDVYSFLLELLDYRNDCSHIPIPEIELKDALWTNR